MSRGRRTRSGELVLRSRRRRTRSREHALTSRSRSTRSGERASTSRGQRTRSGERASMSRRRRTRSGSVPRRREVGRRGRGSKPRRREVGRRGRGSKPRRREVDLPCPAARRPRRDDRRHPWPRGSARGDTPERHVVDALQGRGLRGQPASLVSAGRAPPVGVATRLSGQLAGPRVGRALSFGRMGDDRLQLGRRLAQAGESGSGGRGRGCA